MKSFVKPETMLRSNGNHVHRMSPWYCVQARTEVPRKHKCAHHFDYKVGKMNNQKFCECNVIKEKTKTNTNNIKWWGLSFVKIINLLDMLMS